MSLMLNEEQQLLKEAARGYLADTANVDQLRRLRDDGAADGFDRATWAAMAEMGWTGILVSEDHGGLGFGMTGAAVVAQEMGRTLTASPWFASAVVAATAVTCGETLEKIAAGEIVVAPAFDETSRHAPDRISTVLSDGKLTGTKRHVPDGNVADLFVVSAAEGDQTVLCLVDANVTGVTIERVVMADNRNVTTVTFDEAPILGKTGDAGTFEKALLAGRLCLAAELVGLAEEAFQRTVAYLKERKQFGIAIGNFQALQHRAAHLYGEIELAKSIVMKAAGAWEAGDAGVPALVAAAKCKAAEAAELATREAVQMHGGIGMTDELDIGFFIKRARVAAQLYGDANFQAGEYARLRGY